jgi:hypothetical protein
MSYEVGKFYDVPTVYGEIRGLVRHWPVLGPMHSDGEIIGFAPDHYHLDWRFIGERVIDSVTHHGRMSMFATVIHAGVGSALNPNGLPEPILRRLKCKRQFPNYPHWRAPWMAKLEAHFAGCRLRHRVCPHRGVPLNSLPVSTDGYITCPAHGLRFRADTGELAPTQGGKP